MPINIDTYKEVDPERIGVCNRCGTAQCMWETSKRTGKRYMCEIFEIEGEKLYSHADFHSRYCFPNNPEASKNLHDLRLAEIIDAALGDDDDDIDVPMDGTPRPAPRRRRYYPRKPKPISEPKPAPAPVADPDKTDDVMQTLVDNISTTIQGFTPRHPGADMSGTRWFDKAEEVTGTDWSAVPFNQISKAQDGALQLLGDPLARNAMDNEEMATMVALWLHLQWRLYTEIPS